MFTASGRVSQAHVMLLLSLSEHRADIRSHVISMNAVHFHVLLRHRLYLAKLL